MSRPYFGVCMFGVFIAENDEAACSSHGERGGGLKQLSKSTQFSPGPRIALPVRGLGPAVGACRWVYVFDVGKVT